MRTLGVFAILFLLAIGLVALPKHGPTRTNLTAKTADFHVSPSTTTASSFPADSKVNVVLTTEDDSDNPVGTSLVKAITDTIKSSEAVNFREGNIEDDSADAVNLRVVSTKITDTTASVSVAVVFHSKDHSYSTYLFQVGGVVKKENVDGDVEVLLGTTEQAYAEYISETAK
jgi:hypothetical protein